jgi:hypothetical protein
MDPAFYAAVYGITPVIPTTPMTTASTITTMMAVSMMMTTSLTPETTMSVTQLATTAVSTTTTSEFLVRNANISGIQGMKASGISHGFIPMYVVPDYIIKSTTRVTTPSTIRKRVLTTRARVFTTTSRSTASSKKRSLLTPRARYTTTTTQSKQYIGVKPYVPYPYWKNGGVSRNIISEKSSNVTRLVRPVLKEETIDSTYRTMNRRMTDWNLDRILGQNLYNEPLQNVSSIVGSDHIVPYHVPVVMKSVETQPTVSTVSTTEISTELSINVSTKNEDTTNYGLIVMSSALLFLVGTIPLYLIIGKLVQNISRLKKQRQIYQRVNTDIDMSVRLDNIEGQMINCKRLIEKNLRRNMPIVTSVETMVSYIHRQYKS